VVSAASARLATFVAHAVRLMRLTLHFAPLLKRPNISGQSKNAKRPERDRADNGFGPEFSSPQFRARSFDFYFQGVTASIVK
jgi:hypothetical protein